MDLNLIINELNNRGYHAILEDITKNGVLKKSISIPCGNINLCIYVENFLLNNPDISFQELITQIIDYYEAHKILDDIDINNFLKPAYILEHVYIGMQKTSNELLIKRPTPFEGLEQYLYIRDRTPNTGFTLNLTPFLIECSGLHSIELLWERAQKNTFTPTETVIRSMTHLITDTLDINEAEINHKTLSSLSLYVVTNPLCDKGAAQILNQEAIILFAKQLNVSQLVMLPSSIHECFLLPVPNNMTINLQHFNNIVYDVSTNQVAPEEQLTKRAYIIHV